MADAPDDLAELWRWFEAHHFRGYSPIYERIAAAVADAGDVLELLRQAPPAAHLPLTPLAAVRYLLLDGLDHPLRDVYTGRSTSDPGPLFLDVCRLHRLSLLELLRTRRIQTNDCGRSALIGPALTWVSQQRPGPYCLVDAGASAGLNLLCDRYRLDYGEHGRTGPIDAPVHLVCEVIGGNPPIAAHLPELLQRVGIDDSPIRLADARDSRWLLACTWPDTGRADVVEASISFAQQDPPIVIAGRANELLPAVLRDLPAEATAIVMTTWTFGYFSTAERSEFLRLLRAESQRRHVVWISAENSGIVTALAIPEPIDQPRHDILGALLIDSGDLTAHALARVHFHGKWIDWIAKTTDTTAAQCSRPAAAACRNQVPTGELTQGMSTTTTQR